MRADKIFWKYPKYPKFHKIYLPKLSAQAQMFGILMEKMLDWVAVVRDWSPT